MRVVLRGRRSNGGALPPEPLPKRRRRRSRGSRRRPHEHAASSSTSTRRARRRRRRKRKWRRRVPLSGRDGQRRPRQQRAEAIGRPRRRRRRSPAPLDRPHHGLRMFGEGSAGVGEQRSGLFFFFLLQQRRRRRLPGSQRAPALAHRAPRRSQHQSLTGGQGLGFGSLQGDLLGQALKPHGERGARQGGARGQRDRRGGRGGGRSVGVVVEERPHSRSGGGPCCCRSRGKAHLALLLLRARGRRQGAGPPAGRRGGRRSSGGRSCCCRSRRCRFLPQRRAPRPQPRGSCRRSSDAGRAPSGPGLCEERLGLGRREDGRRGALKRHRRGLFLILMMRARVERVEEERAGAAPFGLAAVCLLFAWLFSQSPHFSLSFLPVSLFLPRPLTLRVLRASAPGEESTLAAEPERSSCPRGTRCIVRCCCSRLSPRCSRAAG